MGHEAPGTVTAARGAGDPGASPAVAMRGITKRFPGVVANDHVDFEAAVGEVHALLDMQDEAVIRSGGSEVERAEIAVERAEAFVRQGLLEEAMRCVVLAEAGARSSGRHGRRRR